MKTTLVLVALGVMVVFQLARQQQWWYLTEFVATTVAVSGTWILFFRSTRCGYITYKQTPCRNPSPGELRGCKRSHKGLKAEALMNHFGLVHPRQRMQGAWMNSAGGNVVAAEPAQEPGKLLRPVFDIATLTATIVGSVAAIVMPIIQMVFQ